MWGELLGVAPSKAKSFALDGVGVSIYCPLAGPPFIFNTKCSHVYPTANSNCSLHVCLWRIPRGCVENSSRRTKSLLQKVLSFRGTVMHNFLFVILALIFQSQS